MFEVLRHFLEPQYILALFITVALGFLLGKIKIKTFVLGGIAGSLIMGVLVGQLDIHMPPILGQMFFALFIYAVGYQGGPQFFRSLNRKTLVQLISATLTCVIGLITVLILAKWFHLDRGTAAGLAAGALTQSAMIGTASAALAKLHISSSAIHTMQSNVAVGYAICYIFGNFGPILMLATIFPALMKWNLRSEAKLLAKAQDGGHTPLDEGQYVAIQPYETRVYKIIDDAKALTKTLGTLFDGQLHLSVEAVMRRHKIVALTPEDTLMVGDTIAVSAKRDSFMHLGTLFGPEVPAPDVMELAEEARHLILSSKTFDGKTVAEFYKMTSDMAHFGVFIDQVSRLGEEFGVTDQLVLRRGDELRLRGRSCDIDRVVKLLGHPLKSPRLTDFISFSVGMILGILIGLLSVRIGGVSISLGTGGGCLFSGLIFGWLRSRHPQIGVLPEGASNFLRDFGLAVFVATVGITAGPQAISSIEAHGMDLFFLGICVTIIPQILTFYISYYFLKIKNPITLLATIAGGRSANPGFAALLEKAGNSTPVVPFTATYAIANIWLTLWGPLIVGLITLNVH
jgi:putative transport protein